MLQAGARPGVYRHDHRSHGPSRRIIQVGIGNVDRPLNNMTMHDPNYAILLVGDGWSLSQDMVYASFIFDEGAHH